MGRSKQLATIIESAPSTLDTLNELAAALGDDANFSTTVTNSIATKSPLADPNFTGDVDIQTTAGKLTVEALGGGSVKLKSDGSSSNSKFSETSSPARSIGISISAKVDASSLDGVKRCQTVAISLTKAVLISPINSSFLCNFIIANQTKSDIRHHLKRYFRTALAWANNLSS